jgi:hypothetical protein
MVIGNFSINNPTKTYMAYWMDWAIIYRSEKDMLLLVEDLNCEDPKVEVDGTGIQLFLRIRKGAEGEKY